MQLLDSGERRLGVFLMLSILIHGLLLYAFPQIRALAVLGSPDGRWDGVIQVFRVEDSTSSQSERAVTRRPESPAKPAPQPKKEQEKPKPEPPKPVETKPEVKEEPATKVVEKPAPAVETKPPAQPKPQEVPKTTSEPDRSSGVTDSGLLTSDKGREVKISEEQKSPAVEEKPPEKSVSEEKPVEEEKPVDSGDTAASKTTTESDTDSGSSTASDTEGTEEPVPPPPPPLPGANSIFPRTRVTYPKGAQNEEASGTWIGHVLFPTGNKSPVILRVVQETGNRSLDSFAQGLVQRGLQFPDAGVDYVAIVEIIFTGSPDYNVRINVTQIDYAR